MGLAGQSRATWAPVLHGDHGYSLKSVNGNASYYYSLPRIATTATLTLGDRAYEVVGDLWMDHEWGTNQLEADQQGWDWFALDFDDGASLMLFQIRRTDGSVDPISSGTWIAADGTATHIPPGSFTLTPSEPWRSAASGAQYPMTWRIQVPAYGLDCQSRARLESCELVTTDTTGITYWEGPVTIEGTRPGHGYLEMTGYAENVGSRF
jgi:predicted secreted hydrolase